MKKILLILLCVLCAACGIKPDNTPKTYRNSTVENLPVADISKYPRLPSSDALVKSGDFEIVNQLYEEGGAFVFYIGGSFCPFCLDMLPVLYETVGEYKIPIVYIDAELVAMNTSAYDTFMVTYDRYLELNDEGEKELFIPFVVMVNNKKVVYDNIGTIETHDAHERGLNDEEITKIKNKLRKALEKLLS